MYEMGSHIKIVFRAGLGERSRDAADRDACTQAPTLREGEEGSKRSGFRMIIVHVLGFPLQYRTHLLSLSPSLSTINHLSNHHGAEIP